MLQLSQSIANAPASTVNETTDSTYSFSKIPTETRNKVGPMLGVNQIRQPGMQNPYNQQKYQQQPNQEYNQQPQQQYQQNQQQQLYHQQHQKSPQSGYLSNVQNNLVKQPPSLPIYQSGNSTPTSNFQKQQKPFDIPKAVNSIVDNWEADLARSVTRRPSGQFDTCNFFFFLPTKIRL